jgi:hypothetical protein
MTAEERLESLKAWCEEQKYVKPGECGTLGIGPRQFHQMSYAGPVKIVHHQYAAPIAPPSYETAMAADAKKDKKHKKGGLMKRWLKRKQKGDENIVE